MFHITVNICNPLKPKGQVTYQKFSSHLTENIVFITKTNQLMAFTEMATIYYSENNINTQAHCVGKMRNCLLHGRWCVVIAMVHYPREVKFNVASYGT
jgi:hypothetical protein